MKKSASHALFQERKLKHLPRADRPRCGARTRAGGECRAQGLANGRCRMHGGLSTGPRTKAGRAANRERAREQMNARWECYRTEGNGRAPLTDAGREKIRQTARRTMRMRWAKVDAARWSAWLMRQHADHTVRLWGDYRRKVILQPYVHANECGGLEQMRYLAEVAGIDLRSLPDGAEITSVILARYSPKYDIATAAEDLRKGAMG